jgi:hypothetical protein
VISPKGGGIKPSTIANLLAAFSGNASDALLRLRMVLKMVHHESEKNDAQEQD